MNAIERLVAVSKGQSYDRVPIFCNLFDQGAIELGMSIKEYYSKGENVAQGQLLLQKKYGHDNLWSMFYVGKEAELWGAKHMIFAKDGLPNVGDMVIRNYDDIHTLKVPKNIIDHPAFAESKKCLDLLSIGSNGEYPICAYITSSMSLPAILMGMEKWMELLLFGPTEVRDELLEKCSEFFKLEIAAYRKAGANVLVYSNPFASTDIITNKIFNELSLKWIEKDLFPEGVANIVYYCGARLYPNIDRIYNEFGISIYYLSPQEDIKHAKQVLNNRGICIGVFNDILLIDYTEKQIRQEVKRIMQEGVPGSKFAFGTSGVPYHASEKNIHAMIDAAYLYGQCKGANIG